MINYFLKKIKVVYLIDNSSSMIDKIDNIKKYQEVNNHIINFIKWIFPYNNQTCDLYYINNIINPISINNTNRDLLNYELFNDPYGYSNYCQTLDEIDNNYDKYQILILNIYIDNLSTDNCGINNIDKFREKIYDIIINHKIYINIFILSQDKLLVNIYNKLFTHNRIKIIDYYKKEYSYNDQIKDIYYIYSNDKMRYNIYCGMI